MAVVQRHKWTTDEVCAALTLLDPLLFVLAFWAEDMTIPESRLDLPAEWRGNQIVTLEQRKMAYDGAVYRLWRDALPEAASESSRKVAMRTSRKIAKTLLMEAAIIQTAMTKTLPGVVEGMIHTPRENHMAPLRNRIEKKLDATPLFRMMRRNFDRENGILNFHNGWTWHFRIEGSSGTGTNMVGLRASVMIGDEADYSQDSPYNEREQTALPGCAQLWGGVPRGVRGVFWRVCNLTSESKSWSIHRYDIRANPLYHSQEAFADQVKGDWYSQRVQTQVFGRDGEEAVSSFPIVPVDSVAPYAIRRFSSAEYSIYRGNIGSFLNLPVALVDDAESWMVHLDYGYSPSPTELGISYLKNGTWNVFARIEMMRVDNTPMAEIIHEIDTAILPRRAALIVTDAHGQGRGVLSSLHSDPRYEDEDYGRRAVAVGFEGTTPIPGVKAHRKCKQPVRIESRDGMYLCDYCGERLYGESELMDATVSTKVFLTNELKLAFVKGQNVLDSGRNKWPDGVSIVLGNDPEVQDELGGTTEIQSQGGVIRYVTPQDVDHMTDMLRCLVSGISRINAIETDYDNFDADYEASGWVVDPASESHVSWQAPWS